METLSRPSSSRLVPKKERNECADVWSLSVESFQQSLPAQRLNCGVVQHATNVEMSQMPGECRRISTVQQRVDGSSYITVESICKVLILVAGFQLPIFNEQGMKNIACLPTDLNLSSITDKSIHRSMTSDVILQRVHKLLLCCHPIGIKNDTVVTNKDLSGCLPTIDSWRVQLD